MLVGAEGLTPVRNVFAHLDFSAVTVGESAQRTPAGPDSHR